MHSPVSAIYSNRCWLEGLLQPATIYMDAGKISDIKKGSKQDRNAEDVGDYILMPGLIDAHVHINEPGRTAWEGFDSGTKAAAAGGITTIVDMPLNASPATVTTQALKTKLESTKRKLHVNAGFYAGLVPGSLQYLEPLLRAGVQGVKVFLTHSGIDDFPNVTEQYIDEAMPLIARYQVPLLVHCELSDDTHNDVLSKNPTSYKAYLLSRPKEWENVAISLMIKLCEKHNCKTHIVHVSSSEALAMIANAKKRGLPITAETCPHYIYFNAEDIPDGDPLYKCAPPIREKSNNQQLKQALRDGTLDFIATDHSPAPPSLKEIETGNFQKAWGGIAGLQFLLPASWTALKDSMSIEQFIPLVTSRPAQFLQLQDTKGTIKIGADADLVVWSPEESFIVKQVDIFHKHRLSPYINKQISGVVYKTYVNGWLVFEDKHIINQNKGAWLLRK